MHYVCENFSLWLKFFAEITHKNSNNDSNNNNNNNNNTKFMKIHKTLFSWQIILVLSAVVSWG